MRRITIREVARRAGVSHQTVSRVINNSPDVSAETREQVQQAILELDYHPNAQAVSLSRNRSNIVGMIVDRAGDMFFGPMVDGACQALTEHGRFMLLAQTDHLAQPSAIEALLRSRRIDGLILALPIEASLEQARQLAQRRLPLVLVDLQYALDADHIAVDNFLGAYQATEHLIKLGHRRIGLISGRQDIPVGQVRLDGYRAAFQAHGVAFDEGLIVPGQFNVASGEQGAELLLGLAEPPTAIFTGDDHMALGAMRAIARHKLRIPQDISLVGFDDMLFAEHTSPPLTTVRQPLHEMGYLAGKQVCQVIDGMAGPLRMTLAPELIVRASTAPPSRL
jgi:DNA-binding LacI/PurR family transcriptional regulator